ncbi:DUF1971 domain-containing protein [uncultured Roseobacter sp.]|uniref:DUF1971 domain-containing protein n=1 Tax=uncultured Roseobacter sp. TaxID=114847 RepID=UPI00260709C5|nr:DUF1971 domain-containing protein [uncultured Roseobacter sp.]
MPEGLQKYRETPPFTASDVPPSLLRDHATKEGVWACVCVTDGRISLHIVDDDIEQMHELSSGEKYLVAPMLRHRVALSEDAVFHIEFLQQALESDDDPHD